jgi:hypothetical protein
MHKLYTHHYSVETAIPVSGLGQRKAQQIGKTIGVLVQNQHGRVATVTDLGRCTWLNQDVTGAGVPVITDNSKVNARLIAENERLQARITGYRHTLEMDDYISVLQDAFEIIQADANTEQNYGSLCRIGSVLAKLKATPTKADDHHAPELSCTNPECGRFFCENAKRYTCRARFDDACAIDHPTPTKADGREQDNG